MGVRRGAYKVLVGKPAGKGPRWSKGEYNIKIWLQEIGWEGVEPIIWLRTRTNGRLLWRRQWTFEFRKIQGIVSFSRGLSSVEFLYFFHSNTYLNLASSYILALCYTSGTLPVNQSGAACGRPWRGASGLDTLSCAKLLRVQQKTLR